MRTETKSRGRSIAGWMLIIVGVIMVLVTIFDYNSLGKLDKQWYNYIEYLYDLDPGYGLLFLVGSIAIIAGIVVLATRKQVIVVSADESSQGAAKSEKQSNDAFADMEAAKKMFDAGLITQEDFEKTKKRILGN